ncbi:MAG TPA: FHA domain-containing protein [Anaerolineales bacterium]|nr:FHA domain-containing protein [Anaerolineales bacterium]
MPFIVVSVEVDSREKIELSLPLNVPSRGLAATIMRDLGKLVRTGETFALFVKTARGEKRIPASETLGEFGIVEGQQLRIRRESGGLASDPSRPHAYVQTRTGVLIALDADTVIIGRKDPGSPSQVDLDLSRYDPNNAISRRHACIVREGRKYSIVDLNSTNGTRLNGNSLLPGKKVPLTSGDVIEFGGGLPLIFMTAEARAKARGHPQTDRLAVKRGKGSRS